MTAVTFDPAQTNANVTLSGGNLVATAAGLSSVSRSTMATVSLSPTDQKHWEITVGSLGGYSRRIGIVVTLPAGGTAIGTAADEWGYLTNNGTVYNNGSALGGFAGAALTTGDVLGMDYDGPGNKLYFYKNGTLQGDVTTAGATYYAAVSLNDGDAMTANFGATDFAYASAHGYSGIDSPAPTPGIGAATMEALTASGARIAAGAVTISALTAVGGMNGFGAVTIPALTVTASGGHSGGDCTVPALTAAGTGYQASHAALTLSEITATSTGVTGGVGTGAVIAEVLDSAGTGRETPISDGDSTLAKLTASGTGTSASVGWGAVTLEYMTAEGHVAPAGAVVFAKPTASASGTVGIIGSAVARATALTAAATGTTPVISIAAAQFNKLTAQGVGTTVVVGTGAVTIQKVQAAATGFGGSVGTAALEIALMTAAATGYPVVTAAGAIVMPAMYADGHATQTVTETYNTWVMNTRNLDMTSYTNYLFNSFTEFNGTQYAAGPAGISKLTGTDDAGTDIAAVVRTGNLADTNSGLLKIPEILLTTESAGPLTVSVITDAAAQYDYTTPYVGIDTPIQVRVEPGKGLRGLGYQVEIKNNDGAAFSIVEMNVPLEKTKRRLGDR